MAVAGQYENEATVVGTIPDLDIEVEDSDLSHYFGVRGDIDIEKSTNGERRRPGARSVRGARLDGHLDLRRHEHRQHAS